MIIKFAMSAVKYLHILTKDKFSLPYILFVKKNFSFEQHIFFSFGKNNMYTNGSDDLRNVVTLRDYVNFYKECGRVEKIIAHGIFSSEFIIFFFLFPKFIKKIHWAIWGRDLYVPETKGFNIFVKLFFLIRKSVLSRIEHTIKSFEPDFLYFKEHYNKNAVNSYCFGYLSNVFDSQKYRACKKIHERPTYLMVGHCASEHIRHAEIFEHLEKLSAEKEFMVICPLAYGDPVYRDEVVALGKSLFGKRFMPIIKYMEYQEYLNLLYNIDIAFFMHKNQQAFGNLIQLLGLGKKIYMSDDSLQNKYFQSLGLSIGSYSDVNFHPLKHKFKRQNIKIISEMYSEMRLISDWKKIFS